MLKQGRIRNVSILISVTRDEASAIFRKLDGFIYVLLNMGAPAKAGGGVVSLMWGAPA